MGRISRDELYSIISSCDVNADLNYLDVSGIVDMVMLFAGNSTFNGDISGWDVSNVKSMRWMFENSTFNGDISKWDVSGVDDMGWMFQNSRFNGDISKWNMRSVTSTRGMFAYSDFRGDISKWDVSGVMEMSYMFSGCGYSDVRICDWDISDKTKMGNIGITFVEWERFITLMGL